jgi:hypothetical protein
MKALADEVRIEQTDTGTRVVLRRDIMREGHR